MLKNIFVLIALVVLGSCASMRESYEAQVCNENGGYERGMNDSRSGKAMDQSFTQVCSAPDGRVASQKGYRDGYQAGLDSSQERVPSTQINVNIGGGAAAAPANKYYCEVHAFTKTFSGWGSTEVEAQMRAKEQCTQQYHPMHCDSFDCRH